jgi:HTH-type transcriptional regulator / antitoxin HipB
MWTNAYSYEDIGQFLREARRARGITQAQMAKKLGFSTVTLSALETGKNVSSAKVEYYLQMLGYRMVIVPKTAQVEVSE